MEKRIFIFILIFNAIICQSVFAQILIEEGKVEKTVEPGKTQIGTISVNNTSDQEIQINAYLEDFAYIPPYDGSKKFLPARTTDHSCVSWVNFSPQRFTLGPYAKKKVTYVINPPKDVSGGYYGVLFFERDPGNKVNEKGVRIITRVGCLFFLETPDRIKKGSIRDIRIEEDMITGTLQNNGNVILIPKGIFYVMDNDGNVYDRGEQKKMYIPPNKEADFRFSLSDKLPSGTFIFVLTFDMGEGDTLVREIRFVKEASLGFRILSVKE